MNSVARSKPHRPPGPAARRVAANTILQVSGDVVSRLVALGFYAVLARRLGAGSFGMFTFALSLIALMLLADSAIDEVLARDVAAKGSAPATRTGDALLAKLGIGATLGAAAVAFAFIGSDSWLVRAVVCLMVLGAVPELAITTLFAVRRGLGDFRTGTGGLLIIRITRAALGITVLLAGGHLLAAAGAYAAGGLAAIAITVALLRSRDDMPQLAFAKGAFARMRRRSWRLAAAGALDTVIVSIGPIALSLAAGATAVGAYGAGIRLAFVTQFVAVALAGAALPLLARPDTSCSQPVREIVGSTLKAAIAFALPVTAFLALFAAPLVQLIYGHGYGLAVTVTRLLAGIVALRAVAFLAFVTLLARDRLKVLLRVPIVALLVELVLLAALTPTLGAAGAAIALLAAELAYATMLASATLKLVGRLSLLRIAGGPIVGAVGMAVAAVALGAGPGAMVVALVAYGLLLLVWERAAYPSDLRQIAVLARLPGAA